MADEKYKDPFMAVSAAIIALTALGVVVFTKVPLKGLRPVTEIREPSDQVRARLWQDPFTAVLEYINSQPKEKIYPEADLCPLFTNLSLQIQEAVKKGALPKEIAKDQGKVTALGVMVFGSPYAEETESRIRQRVAVLSALGQLGYVPEDAEHLSFLRIYSANKPLGSQIELSNLLPYEWLQKKDDQSDQKVLLLWLNDDSFQPQPLTKLNCLLSYLKSANPGIKVLFKVIGPAGSSNLFNMVNELRSQADNRQFPRGLQIFSPTATVSNALLLGLSEFLTSGKLPPNEIEQQSAEKIRNLFGSQGIEFHRTISTDHQLAELLVDELNNRQVDLLLKGKTEHEGHVHNNRDDKNIPRYGGHKDHLILIAEWDTFYGRSLPEIIVQIIRQEHNKGLNLNDPSFLPPDKPVNWVHRYSYLRGLDGIVSGSKEVLESKSATGGGNKGDAEKMRLEEPIGRSQYDYLRRLADRTYQLDQQLRQKPSRFYQGYRDFGK